MLEMRYNKVAVSKHYEVETYATIYKICYMNIFYIFSLNFMFYIDYFEIAPTLTTLAIY